MNTSRQSLIEAAQQLEIKTTSRPWAHLGLAVTDAVFSIGIRYTSTRKAVENYAQRAGLVSSFSLNQSKGLPEQRLSSFIESLEHQTHEENAVKIFGNSTKTSTHASSITKAEASFQFAQALVEHQIETYEDVEIVLNNDERFDLVNKAINNVAGSGLSQVRSGYFWMLVGDESTVKPDRHILRWLNRASGKTPTAAEARILLGTLAEDLGHTQRDLDHAIWEYERKQPRG